MIGDRLQSIMPFPVGEFLLVLRHCHRQSTHMPSRSAWQGTYTALIRPVLLLRQLPSEGDGGRASQPTWPRQWPDRMLYVPTYTLRNGVRTGTPRRPLPLFPAYPP